MTEDKNYKKIVEEHSKDNSNTDLPDQPGLEIWLEEDVKNSKIKKDISNTILNSSKEEDLITHSSRYFEDASSMSEEELETMLGAFSDNVLNVQIDRNNNTYFNPEGMIYLGDLINMLTDKEDTDLIKDSSDGLVKSSDYFVQGYNSLLRDYPNLKGKLSREKLFSPITKRVMCGFLMNFYPLKDLPSWNSPSLERKGLYTHTVFEKLNAEGVFETAVMESFVTRLELSNLYKKVLKNKL